ncbi:MAG: chorismate synthase, partial [Armatimonadota bacterium]
GESHGAGIGVVVDGLPPRLPISLAAIQFDLDRRRPGQSRLTTQRKEPDQVEILSGVSEDGLSLGTPIALLIRNEDARSRDYSEVECAYRPSHADFAYDAKYGIRATAGGGRASARETVARVAAAGLIRGWLQELGIEVLGWVSTIGEETSDVDEATVHTGEIEASLVRCPDPVATERMVALIEAVRKEGDSVGG